MVRISTFCPRGYPRFHWIYVGSKAAIALLRRYSDSDDGDQGATTTIMKEAVMAEMVRFHNGEGASILVETAGSGPEMRDVGGRDVVRAVDERFEAVLDRIRDLSDRVARQLTELATEPDEITVELGVGVTAESQIFIAKASAEGSLKVTMTWKKNERSSKGQ